MFQNLIKSERTQEKIKGPQSLIDVKFFTSQYNNMLNQINIINSL